MAELILTEQEKHAHSYAAWDDAALGRAVKKIAFDIRNIKGDDALACTAAAILLADRASGSKVAAITFPLLGIVGGPECLGRWEVTVRRVMPVEEEARRHQSQKDGIESMD